MISLSRVIIVCLAFYATLGGGAGHAQSLKVPLDSMASIMHAEAFCKFVSSGSAETALRANARMIGLDEFPAVPSLPLDDSVRIWDVRFPARRLKTGGRCGRPLDYHVYIRVSDGAMLAIAVLDTNYTFNPDTGKVDLSKCVLGLLRSKIYSDFEYVTEPPRTSLSKTSSLSGFCGLPESYAGLVSGNNRDGVRESAWALIGMNQRPINTISGDTSRVSAITIVNADSGNRIVWGGGGSCREDD